MTAENLQNQHNEVHAPTLELGVLPIIECHYATVGKEVSLTLHKLEKDFKTGRDFVRTVVKKMQGNASSETNRACAVGNMLNVAFQYTIRIGRKQLCVSLSVLTVLY